MFTKFFSVLFFIYIYRINSHFTLHHHITYIVVFFYNIHTNSKFGISAQFEFNALWYNRIFLLNLLLFEYILSVFILLFLKKHTFVAWASTINVVYIVRVSNGNILNNSQHSFASITSVFTKPHVWWESLVTPCFQFICYTDRTFAYKMLRDELWDVEFKCTFVYKCLNWVYVCVCVVYVRTQPLIIIINFSQLNICLYELLKFLIHFDSHYF